MKKVALIMAGGKGERFWPLSRQEVPKQLLSLYNSRTMVKNICDLLHPIFGQKTYIITNGDLSEKIKACFQEKECPEFLIEPCAKNTAPCLLFATAAMERKYGKDVLLFIGTSDHYIGQPALFAKYVKHGLEAADQHSSLITFGIHPTRIDTGYGYIHTGKLQDKYNDVNIYDVNSFREKPDYEKAKEYVTSGEYLWNSGIFIWKAETFKQVLKGSVPEYFSWYMKMIESPDEGVFKRVVTDFFEKSEPISIDYAVMEKTSQVKVIEATFPWDDIGSWNSLERIKEKDSKGNIVQGEYFSLESSDNIVFAENRPVALFGVKNMVIVETGDLVFICPRDKASQIKDFLKDQEKRESFKRFL